MGEKFMGAFVKMLAQTGSRNRSADVFSSNFSSKYKKRLSEEQRKWYKRCLLSIHAGSNNGSIEDCIRIMNRDLDELMSSTQFNYEEKKYILSSLRAECFNGTTEKYGYWWAKEIIDDYIRRL